jgi:hypothetical protein
MQVLNKVTKTGLSYSKSVNIIFISQLEATFEREHEKSTLSHKILVIAYMYYIICQSRCSTAVVFPLHFRVSSVHYVHDYQRYITHPQNHHT